MFSYGESVRLGVQELQNYINTRLATCPRTFFALGGYSQGAQVIGDTLVTLPVEIDVQVIFSTMYGDPKLYLPEGIGLHPDACRGKNLSAYRAFAPICQTFEGVLGGRKPYVQKFQEQKVATYCNPLDMICGSTGNVLSWDGHTTYIEDGHFWDGARRILEAVTTTLPALFIPEFTLYSPNLVTPGQDVAIVLDTTGSMDNQINEFSTVKNEVRRLSEHVLANGGRVAIVEYRDIDILFSNGAPSRVLCDFDVCTSMDAVNARLAGLTAEGGEDFDESLLYAIRMAFEDLAWRPGASKALVVFTDAGFHDPDPMSRWTLADVQRESMLLNPVNIYVAKIFPAHSGYAASYSYRQLLQLQELAEITGGMATDGRFGISIARMIDGVFRRPLARLAIRSKFAAVGQEITFDATNSQGVSGEIVYADWDLDGDGIFEISGKEMGLDSLRITHAYTRAGTYYAQVRIVDRNGLSNTAMASVTVMDVEEHEMHVPNRMNFMDVDLRAEKAVDEEGTRYLAISWTRPWSVQYYQLYVNGVPLGRFDASMTSAAIYDLDFSRDNTVRVRVILPRMFVTDSNLVVVYADEAGGTNDGFDWSEALEAIGRTPEQTDESPDATPSGPDLQVQCSSNSSSQENDTSLSPEGSESPSDPGSFGVADRGAPDVSSLPPSGSSDGEPVGVPDASRARAEVKPSWTWHWVVATASVLLMGLLIAALVKRRKDRRA
jgi:hypothetical protein